MANMSQLPEVIRYPHGTQRYWIEDGTISVLIVAGSGRHEITEAAAAVRDIIAEAPNPHDVFIVNHAEKLHNLPPAVRQTVNEFFFDLPKDVHLTSAIILSDSLMHTLLGLFLNGVRRITRANLDYHIFHDEASGIEWLKEMQHKRAKAS